MADGGNFFDEVPADQKGFTADPPAAAVPVPAAPTVSNPITMGGAAQPAAPVDPAQARAQALQDAIGGFYNDKQAPDAAQSVMLDQLPYNNLIRNPRAAGAATATVDPKTGVIQFPMMSGGQTVSQSSGGTHLTPEAKAASAMSVDASKKAARDAEQEGIIAKQDADRLSAMQSEMAKQQEAQAKADMDRMTAIQNRVNDTISSGQKFTDDYLAAQKGVDPNRLMKGGRGVMAAIAAGLGAFGASMNRTENFAQQIIDSAIQRDWQAQKDVANAAKFRVEATGQLVNQLRGVLSDEQSVQLAHSAAVKSAIGMRLESESTKNKGTELAARQATLGQQMVASAYQDQAQLLAREQIHASTSVSNSTTPFTGLPQGETALAANERIAKSQAEINKAKGLNPNETDVSLQKEAMQTASSGINILRQLQEARKAAKDLNFAGTSAGLSQKGSDYLTSIRMAMEDYARLQSKGAYTAEEAKGFADQMLGKMSFTSESIAHAIQRFQSNLAGRVRVGVDGLHKNLIDRTWEQIRNAAGDDQIYNGLRTGTFVDAEESANKNGMQLRSAIKKRMEGPAKQ